MPQNPEANAAHATDANDAAITAHQGEHQLKENAAADLRADTRAEVEQEGLPDENSVSKAAVYLNTKLPKTRTIAQTLVRDEAGGVMLCELSYKRFWDLPGGVYPTHPRPTPSCVHWPRSSVCRRASSACASCRGCFHGVGDDAMLYLVEVELDRPAAEVTLQRREIAGIHHVAAGSSGRVWHKVRTVGSSPTSSTGKAPTGADTRRPARRTAGGGSTNGRARRRAVRRAMTGVSSARPGGENDPAFRGTHRGSTTPR